MTTISTCICKSTLWNYNTSFTLPTQYQSSISVLQDKSRFLGLAGWLGFTGPLRQYFSLYQAVSQREGERREKNVWQPPPAPTASAVGPCPIIIPTRRTPWHWKFTQYHSTTRPRDCFGRKNPCIITMQIRYYNESSTIAFFCPNMACYNIIRDKTKYRFSLYFPNWCDFKYHNKRIHSQHWRYFTNKTWHRYLLRRQN